MGFIISVILVKDASKFTQLELRQEKDKKRKIQQGKKPQNNDEGSESLRARAISTTEENDKTIDNRSIHQ